MQDTKVTNEVRDRLEIADALYRFAAGIDFNDADLLISAFAENAVADFTPSAVKLGIEFPVLEGRESIVRGITNSVAQLDTTHVVTNPRIKISGDTAKLYAIVEAQHLPPNDHSRHCLMKNQYDVNLVRNGDRWVIENMLIDNVWFTGDPAVVQGQ